MTASNCRSPNCCTNSVDTGGEWVAPVQRGVFDTLDPSDESVLARVASATFEDVDRAVAAKRWLTFSEFNNVCTFQLF